MLMVATQVGQKQMGRRVNYKFQTSRPCMDRPTQCTTKVWQVH